MPSEATAAVDGCSHVIHLAAIVGGIANFHKLPYTLTEVNNALTARSSAPRSSDARRAVRVRVVLDGVRARDRVPDDRGARARLPRAAVGVRLLEALRRGLQPRRHTTSTGCRYTICRPFNAYGPGELPDATSRASPTPCRT